jgi:hypothetical protein
LGPTSFAQRKSFFVQLIFFPPKSFLVFWKREIFLKKKNFGGKKFTEQKRLSEKKKENPPKSNHDSKIIKI